MNTEPPLIDDFRPKALVRPGSPAELGELVRQAAAEGAGLYPFGGGTMLHLGRPPVRPGYAVDLRGLNRVIDYPARDMTVTVQAGITIADLRQALAAERQRLPIDVPQAERATLGGAIAVNASGPRRFGFGTLRDYVIGISCTDDAGNEVKAGGRVVKNVAGYDLCKLHIGALGTLGIVTQATLKLRPLPQRRGAVRVVARVEELAGLLERVHASATRPVCVDLRRAPDGAALVVGFEDNAETVAWQVEQLRRELDRPAGLDVLTEEAAAADMDWPAEALDPRDVLALKVSLLPAALPGFLAALADDPNRYWLAQAGNGIVTILYGELTPEEAARVVAALRRRAAAGSGSVIVTRCPPAWKADLQVWGEPRGDWALMARVKHELDPRDLFNPGRFVV